MKQACMSKVFTDSDWEVFAVNGLIVGGVSRSQKVVSGAVKADEVEKMAKSRPLKSPVPRRRRS